MSAKMVESIFGDILLNYERFDKDALLCCLGIGMKNAATVNFKKHAMHAKCDEVATMFDEAFGF